ncbi:MAG: hypothetical protein HPY69_00055 [Armatimonadetes bacterium]|nr:hypothetical protein [Armatimonadota bacterium]
MSVPGPLLTLALVSALALAATVSHAADAEARYVDGWPVCVWDGQPLGATGDGPALTLTVDDEPLSLGAPVAAGPLRVTYQTPAGVVTDSLQPFPAFPNCFRREVTFTNNLDKQRDLLSAELRVAWAAPTDARHWSAQSFAMAECSSGGPTLCVAYTSNEDFHRTQLDMASRPLARHQVGSVWRLPPGGTAVIGSQYLWVIPEGLAAARASAQDWYEAVGLRVAGGDRPWLVDCVMYQACAGGSVDSMFGDTGGFDNFARQLDYLADLGCNAFWLMSVTTHKDPASPRTGWNLYGPLSFSEVDPAYGGEAALGRLTEAMRARGFRVLGEIVPHGGGAEVAASHSEWWTYQRDGERSRGFGQAMDYSAPGWQDTIHETIRWLTAGWGFEGYRVDVAEGFGVNWKSPTNGPHVSRSTMGGFLGMLRAIRDGTLKGGCPAPVIIPESAPRPEAAPYAPVTYTWPLDYRFGDWFAAGMSAEQIRTALTRLLAEEQGSLPRGMVQLRAINNHDTVVEHGRADRRYGVGLQRALTAVCCLVEGVPMIYQEQEVGSYDYFRRLFWARRRVPELCRGAADYTGVRAPDGVFAVLRTLEGSHALGLVNLSAQPVEGEVTLPGGVIPAAGTTLHDAITGRELAVTGRRFTWRLEPYGCAVLRIGLAPEGQMPEERHQPQSAGSLQWRVTAEGGTLTETPRPEGGTEYTFTAEAVATGELRLQLTGVDRWLATAVTGVYEDRLMRRHYPWPAEGGYHWDPTMVWGFEPHHLYRACLPAGRQWQSAVAPLLADGFLAFAGADGQAVRIAGIETNAHNVVLTDRSEEPDPEPYGLTLRFLARDEALNPWWSPAYQRSGWVEIPNPHALAPMEPLRVSFHLAPGGDFVTILRQAPGPAPASEGRREVGLASYHEGSGRLWFPEPNTVRWTGLPLSQSGDYTLWLELRHSERGPQETELTPHYQITLDGQPVAFEWQRLNAWSTGNGYFGWAKAKVGRLESGLHSVEVRTTHTWCALQSRLYISRDPGFVPGL